MLAPFSQYRYITPVLILLSMGIVAIHMLLGSASPRALWLCWGVAGVLTAGIRHIVARFRLDGGASVKAFAIGWPLLTQVLCFACCHLPTGASLTRSLVEQLALLAILSLQMSLWQRRAAVIKHLLLGLIIGLTSTIHPPFILFALLLPVTGYYMRCISPRNLSGAFTGALLGIWFTYLIICLLPFFTVQSGGMEAADRMAARYLDIIPFSGQWLQRTILWEGSAVTLPLMPALFLGYLALMLLIYTFRALAVDVGQSVRAEASNILLSVVSLAVTALLIIDASGFTAYIGMLATLLALQLTIHQANTTSLIAEWWIMAILLIGTVLCLLPLFV